MTMATTVRCHKENCIHNNDLICGKNIITLSCGEWSTDPELECREFEIHGIIIEGKEE